MSVHRVLDLKSCRMLPAHELSNTLPPFSLHGSDGPSVLYEKVSCRGLPTTLPTHKLSLVESSKTCVDLGRRLVFAPVLEKVYHVKSFVVDVLVCDLFHAVALSKNLSSSIRDEGDVTWWEIHSTPSPTG